MYLVFAWESYEEAGGANDLIESCESIEKAVALLKSLLTYKEPNHSYYRYDTFQIYGVDENAVMFEIDALYDFRKNTRIDDSFSITINEINFKGVLIDD